MTRFNLNSARSYVGHNVNLHLKNGSVIINVVITDIRKNDRKGGATLLYATPTKRNVKIYLKEIEKVERLNPYILMALKNRRRIARRRSIGHSN